MKRSLIPVAIVVATGLVVIATLWDAKSSRLAARDMIQPPAALPGDTSRQSLGNTVESMSARLREKPEDAAAAVRLVNALMRLQRVNNDGRAVITAEQHLRELLGREPDHYEARHLLSAVLLSQHRFGEAIAEANKVIAVDPSDPWNYGAVGDGYMELGDYDRAFQAFDRMGQIKPGPSAYARTSYALEIQGDLPAALEYMRRAADGTTPRDPEAQAWHYSQLGELLLKTGRLGDAKREFERAAATFPDHPMAVRGLATIKIIEGDLDGARLMYQRHLSAAPTFDAAIMIGDLLNRMGDASQAEQYYRVAEQLERASWTTSAAQPQVLARFFADRDRNLGEAVKLAEAGARSRRDIFTMDALAWTYYKAGRMDEAMRASAEAMRTGSRDAAILVHAAEITAAAGSTAEARRILERIPAPDCIAEPALGEQYRALRARLIGS